MILIFRPVFFVIVVKWQMKISKTVLETFNPPAVDVYGPRD
jgi:hypothetical protein